MPLALVTGGARSGKSAFAQDRAEEHAAPHLYIATAEPGDDEMRERIARHRAERGPRWLTVEAPLDPCAALRAASGVGSALIDCVTLWISNLLSTGATDAAIEQACRGLADRARDAALPVFIVTNEVGMGIVPEHPIARRFRDVAGRANQSLARAAGEVWLLVAGQPVRVK
jgi:adenosylcobinamide kinase/adenosylcobinamide-phosphate guanylyltransferase